MTSISNVCVGHFVNHNAKPLALQLIKDGGGQPPSAAKRHGTAPLHGATPAGRPARGPVGQRACGQSRGKSASGSGQKTRTLKSAKRGTECVPAESRSF